MCNSDKVDQKRLRKGDLFEQETKENADKNNCQRSAVGGGGSYTVGGHSKAGGIRSSLYSNRLGRFMESGAEYCSRSGIRREFSNGYRYCRRVCDR